MRSRVQARRGFGRSRCVVLPSSLPGSPGCLIFGFVDRSSKRVLGSGSVSLPDGWIADGWERESGQAWVYRVRSVSGADPERFALKRLKNPDRERRFTRELEAMIELGSAHGAAVPHIVAHDLADQRPWFVMPWYEGGSLQEAVDEATFGGDAIGGVRRLIELATILNVIHGAGYAHRDLKPANILVAADGSLALTDFGLCLELSPDATRLTALHEVIGSRNYIAPENEGGINEDFDQRPADFYAYGKIAWALLAGRNPPPREEVADPENALVRRADDPRLRIVDALVRDTVVRDLRARLASWDSVVADLRIAESGLEGQETFEVGQVSDRVVRAARRLRHSAAVEHASSERGELERRQNWMSELQLRMRQAPIVNDALREVIAELRDVLTIGVGLGGPARREQLEAATFRMPSDEEFAAATVFGNVSDSAVCFMIHSPRGIASFPTFNVRVWAVFSSKHVWLLRVPMVAPFGGQEVVADSMLDAVGLISGPFEFGRHSTIETAVALIEDTSRLFVSLVDGYLEIADAGDDPSNPSAWAGRAITAAELPARADDLSDTQAPELRGFRIEPETVHGGTEPAVVTCVAHLVDDRAGIAGRTYTSSPSQVRFRSPSKQQFQTAMFTEEQRVAGDELDGHYESRMTLPPFSEQGTWRVEYFLAVDAVGNSRRYNEDELRGYGFPSAFDVV